MSKPIQVRGREGRWFACAAHQACGPFPTIDEAIDAARRQERSVVDDVTFDRVRAILHRLIANIDPDPAPGAERADHGWHRSLDGVSSTAETHR